MLLTIVGSNKNINLYKKMFNDKDFTINYLVIDNSYSTENNIFKNPSVYNSDYLITLTENDSLNIYLCKVAKEIYNIPYTISLLNNEDNEFMMKKEHIDLIICPSLIIKNSINNFLLQGGVEKCTL